MIIFLYCKTFFYINSFRFTCYHGNPLYSTLYTLVFISGWQCIFSLFVVRFLSRTSPGCYVIRCGQVWQEERGRKGGRETGLEFRA